jgi:hypothetical protein
MEINMQKAHQPPSRTAIPLNFLAESDFVREAGISLIAVNSHFAEQKDKLILVLQQSCQSTNCLVKWCSYKPLI